MIRIVRSFLICFIDFYLQVYLGSGGALDVEGKELPRLVYMSREKRPGYQHHKKAGAMNALVSNKTSDCMDYSLIYIILGKMF